MGIFDQKYSYAFPTQIRFGKDVIQELGPHLTEQDVRRPLIVTDATLSELGFFKQIIQDLSAQGIPAEVFNGIHKNPIKSDVLTGVEQFHAGNCDAIIGIGGGAAIDVARAIALKAHHTRDLFEYEDGAGGDKLVTEAIPYFVTVPTTSGTGSEVGRSAVISDDITKQKKILFSPRLMAKQVFADPMLTMELPPAVTAATGMDALSHNIEAYLAKGFHPLCDGIALKGIRLIGRSLVNAVQKPDLASRSQMMMAALMGAVAFQKGLGVVHSTAHPLSTLFDIHHGLANAIMLHHGVAFNADVSVKHLITVSEVLHLEQHSPEAVIQYLSDLNAQIGLPRDLSSQGVTEEDVEPLSRLAFADACHASNPKAVSQEDFKTIYRAAL